MLLATNAYVMEYVTKPVMELATGLWSETKDAETETMDAETVTMDAETEAMDAETDNEPISL